DQIYGQTPCYVFECRETTKGTDNGVPVNQMTRSLLWVCPSKSHLPLRREYYLIRKGIEQLEQVSQVEDLMELEKDIFFPKTVATVKYDVSEKKSKPMVRQLWQFERVRLKPNYPPERFGDVTFLDGSPVFVV